MRTFRLLLSLILCLTVPVAGWASVLSVPACNHAAAAAMAQHHHPVPATAHSHDDCDHCTGDADHGAPGHADQCGCGCGFGLCSASVTLGGLVGLRMPYLSAATMLPGHASVPHADSPGASLLRPPIA